MQNTSAAYKAAIIATDRTVAVRGTIQTADATIYNLTGEDIVSGTLSVSSMLFDSSGFAIGGAYASECRLSLYNDDGSWNAIPLDGATLRIESGILLPDDTIEYVLLGTFIIDQPGRPYRVLSIGAADRLILLDVPFVDVDITFPATNLQTIAAIAAHCGVTLSPAWLTALNIGYTVTERPTDDLSCRDVVGMIAAMAAGNARASREGLIDLVTLPDLSGTIAVEMPVGSRFEGFRQTTDPVSITGLNYADTAETVQLGTTEYALQLDHIPLLQANRDTVLSSIWTAVEGFTYTGFSCPYPGNPAIDPGDSVRHVTTDSRTIVSMITSHTFAHGRQSTMKADAVSRSEGSYRDANARRISSIASKVTALDTKVTNYQGMSAQISDLLSAGLGLYKTEQVQIDGSVIVIYHNKSTLAASDIQWKMSAGAFAVSHDYGATWAAGITAAGEMLVTVLTAIGVKADWIKVGGSGADGTIEIKDASNHVIATLGTDGVKLFDTAGNQIGGNALIGALQSFVSGALTDDPTNPAFWARIGQLVQGLYTYRGIFGYNKDFSSATPAFALTSGSNGSVSLLANKGKQLNIGDDLTDGSGYYGIHALKHPSADAGVLNLTTSGSGGNAGLTLNYSASRGFYVEMAIFNGGWKHLGIDAGGVYTSRGPVSSSEGSQNYLNGGVTVLSGVSLNNYKGVDFAGRRFFFHACTNTPSGISWGFLEVLYFEGTGFAPRGQGAQKVTIQRVTNYDGTLMAMRCYHDDDGTDYWDSWTIVSSSGGSSGGSDVLAESGLQSIIANSAAETTIFSGYTLPGGTIIANGSINLRVVFELRHDVVCTTSIRVKIGTTVITIPFPQGVADPIKAAMLDLVIANAASTSSQRYFWRITYQDGSGRVRIGSGATSINTTTDQSVEISVQHSVADAGCIYSQYHTRLSK